MSDTTQTPSTSTPITTPRKRRFSLRPILLGALGLIILIALGGLGGYFTASNDRTIAESTAIAATLQEQYVLAELNIQQGAYGAAQQRLEFIIQNDPSYPGAAQRLTDVLLLLAVPTATVTPSPTPTVDLRGVEEIFQRAQQYVNIQDWANAISSLDSLRRKDSTYRTAEVDGMYYFCLRNYGFDLITKQGNLEGGVYHLTLAERFGPLDKTAFQLREGAQQYVVAASFWQLDWKNAVNYFSQVATGWPSMWDGTMTASERYRVALMRYGDDLYVKEQYCEASKQYALSATMGTLDAESQRNANKSYIQCFPPTEIIPPTLIITPP